MTTYASELPDFEALLRATAQRLDIPLSFVEKDYYVVRALKSLLDQMGGQFLFKGGTSLSKCWGILDRFSEDIDLLVLRQRATSNNEVERTLKRIINAAAATHGFSFKPVRSSKCQHRSGLLSYKPIVPYSPHVSSSILLELGVRGGTHPNTTRAIQSFVSYYATTHGHADLADDLSAFEIDCLDVSRTFVEKLCAVYAQYQTDYAATKARHYYDLYKLAGLSEVVEFVRGPTFDEILLDVRKISLSSFPNTPLLPVSNISDCECFRPPQDGLLKLAANYKKEETLFYRTPPSMEEILERVSSLLASAGR